MENDYKRLMQFVLGKDKCWEWQGSLDKDGYGWYTQKGKLYRAHRASYRLLVGNLTNLPIDHLCRNRRCVNPNHMELVTVKENTLRSPIAPAAVNSRKTHCRSGHEYTPLTMKVIKSSGERRCRTCERNNKQRFRAKRRALGLPYV